MASSNRSAYLSRYFRQVERGEKRVLRAADAKLFLEAVCGQVNHFSCVEKLVSHSKISDSLQKSIRFDLSLAFLNGPVSAFLVYLQEPGLEQFCNGRLLQTLLLHIMDPPTLWAALVEAHRKRSLTDICEAAFGWLMLQLLRLPSCPDIIKDDANRTTAGRLFLDSSAAKIRSFGYKIDHVLNTTSTLATQSDEYAPGGRHDNDFADFRKISILPTPDELTSTEAPFYRKASEVFDVPETLRPATHYDNQFRLLREDLLAELRNDLQVARGQKKGKRTSIFITGLVLKDVDCGVSNRRKPCSLIFECQDGIPRLSKMSKNERTRLIEENRNFLKHQSLGCLLSGDDIISFACVERNESLLVEKIPALVLQIPEVESLKRILLRITAGGCLDFIAVNTAVFAYEPILRCLQEKKEFSLSDSLLTTEPSLQSLDINKELSDVVDRVRASGGKDLEKILRASKGISLDKSQFESLLTGLTHSLSLIQGPPGTGKSFIGALLAKALSDNTKETILVLCYTNHALDQFLEDLMDIGIPDNLIVRLGSKFTARTKKLCLFEQRGQIGSRMPWTFVSGKKDQLNELECKLRSGAKQFLSKPSNGAILEHLEFFDHSGLNFYDAFSVPEDEHGMERVGPQGKKMDNDYLLNRWVDGKGAGTLESEVCKGDNAKVWSIDTNSRRNWLNKWLSEIVQERIDEFSSSFSTFNEIEKEVDDFFYSRKHSEVLKKKRIIGCTTTAAAKYATALRAANPGIILVEEAGEILESHILTAMTEVTKQLILIGDHKQLRPKVNNYELTVEKGNGFDLNMSMFERLVVSGFPNTTLLKQHRMRPEISQLIRCLTYPELVDAERTQNRPNLRGFQDNIIFVSHEHPELELHNAMERRDPTAKCSKQNEFEVQMILKCIRYLGQQGYGTDKLVVLTPYLGQLHLLQRELGESSDPVLNDLDSFDLVRAGLVTQASANMTKRPIRISTIDNYQGEESDIVLVSLTRSNEANDIGFMASPERVNVLLSRARNALILIGNANTFLNSRKGNTVWKMVFENLNRKGHVYDGFPVKCERHPARKAIIQNPEDFDRECPEGGCTDRCTTKLSCGIHTCPQRCHELHDHSKMACGKVVEDVCPNKHKYTWRCHKGRPSLCPKCEAEARIKEEKKKRDFDLEVKRQILQQEHARKLAEIQEKIDEQQRILKDVADDKQRQAVLTQKSRDLDRIKVAASQAQNPQANISPMPAKIADSTLVPSQAPVIASDTTKKHTPTEPQAKQPTTSAAKDEWEYYKRAEGQVNEFLDSLMDMIGLEEVKESFLSVKAKVDTVVRQNASLKDERYSAALLGNPGTGKTTVARLYAKFLSSVGVIPGSHFVETSGSRLASEGVSGCKKHLEDICNNGGGALFIDEAYQLVSGRSSGGGQVLDFLLAEVENLTGKVVFIIAGYNKNMEDFFSHNPGIPSRFPIELQFRDYTDVELQKILRHRLNQKYDNGMKIEGGMDGLYVRIVARRIGRGRGHPGFGNARSVHNEVSRITDRQAKRLQLERRLGMKPDDMLLLKEDIIDPEPGSVLDTNAAWEKLQGLTGLGCVKDTIKALFRTIQLNYQRELEEKPYVEYSLNKVFIGNPGTGKTTVAKLYGQILADMGLLSSGEVVVKNPSDFVGDVLGASENITKGILASTIGKVLVIDEAYMLGATSSQGSSEPDIFKTAVIDTIVAEVQSVAGDDRCVLLLGYKAQMEQMFQNVNPGLSRRFPMDSAFQFEDYSDDDLQKILHLKLKQAGFSVTPEARLVVKECLNRARNRPHFGNAGEIDILLDKAKLTHQKRLSARQTENVDTLEPLDFDPDFDRANRVTNCAKLFEGVIGCEYLIAQLEGYQRIVAKMKKLGMDPREQIPFNFLFRGPPGTGKTSTARRMGKVFYDMGFLATAEVVECSATDLVGQYVGHTGPKTQKLLEKALGKVLFIDEAYRLAEGHFAKEAMDELVDCLTKPTFAQKLIVILAGYDEDINRLMSINPGLTSRFPEAISFHNLTLPQCLELFQKSLEKNRQLDIKIVCNRSKDFEDTLLNLFSQLKELPAWGNARDILTLSKLVTTKVLADSEDNTVTEDMITSVIRSMILEREKRKEAVRSPVINLFPDQARLPENPPNAPVKTSIATKQSQLSLPDPTPKTPEVQHSIRDSDVPNDVWMQLQADLLLAEEQNEKDRQRVTAENEVTRKVAENTAAETLTAMKIEEEQDSEARRLLEEERLRNQKARHEYEEKVARLVREKLAREGERKKEQLAQMKLRQMGVCVQGYKWIKQAGGYRCAGGAHFIPDAQLGL